MAPHPEYPPREGSYSSLGGRKSPSERSLFPPPHLPVLVLCAVILAVMDPTTTATNTLSAAYSTSSSPLPAVIPHFEIQRVILSALVGIILQGILYGILCMSAWKFFRIRNKADPWWFIALLVVASALCTLNLIMAAHVLWFLVTSQKVVRYPWSIDFFLMVTATVVALARLLFVQRSWISPHSVCIVAASAPSRRAYSWLGSDGRPNACRVSGIYISFCSTISYRREPYRSEAISDPLLRHLRLRFVGGHTHNRCSVCVALRRTNRDKEDRLPSQHPHHIYARNSLVEGIGLITLLANSDSEVYLAFYIQTASLYLISLLTSLNARALVRKRIQQPISVNFSALDADTADPTSASASPPSSVGAGAGMQQRPASARVSSGQLQPHKRSADAGSQRTLCAHASLRAIGFGWRSPPQAGALRGCSDGCLPAGHRDLELGRAPCMVDRPRSGGCTLRRASVVV
ncbi:hypothetical protein BD413DRAFT_188304 [Trametes elegans]|nr:hypothetical protein BD413DRAFT_188304 [Trametes elegans]